MRIYGLWAIGTLSLILSRPAATFAEEVVADPKDHSIILTAKVLLPDGSPATGAKLQSFTGNEYTTHDFQADATGLVAMGGVFGNGANLLARSSDGTLQATRMIAAHEIRAASSEPVLLQLKPAMPLEVTVVSQGQPVENATVMARGHSFKVQGNTNAEGKARLLFPDGEHITDLVAWHPELGVAGAGDLSKHPLGEAAQLALLPSALHTIRVVDTKGKPVAGIELGVSFRTETSDWLATSMTEASHVATDKNGEVVLPWAPREKLEYVDAILLETSRWKINKTDREQVATGLTTVELRRKLPVTGRVIMPAGESAEGLLITGFGFGPNYTGDIPYARVRCDGTFTMQVPAYHGYVLGISDHRWVSDPWTGLILGDDPKRPAKIEIEPYLGTPITVHVTRGLDKRPVKDAWLYAKNFGNVKFVDELGEEQSGTSGVGVWMRSNANGEVHAVVARGEVNVRISHGDWNEEQTRKVDSDEPIEVVFHRNWMPGRRVTARMTHNGAAYTPSENLNVYSWSKQTYLHLNDIIHQPKIRDDGTIEVVFDAETVAILAIDREKGVSGYQLVGAKDSSAELEMLPTATYSGTIYDDRGQLLAGRTVLLSEKSSRIEMAPPQQTDSQGYFEFSHAPAGLFLRVRLQEEQGMPRSSLLLNKKKLKPGEEYYAGLEVHQHAEEDKTKRRTLPLSKQLANACRNASVSRMHALLLLKGDDSADLLNLTSRLFDTSKTPVMRSYMPLTLAPQETAAEASFFNDRGWPIPDENELVLIVVGREQKLIATKRIDTQEINEAWIDGAAFLEQHRHVPRNALDLLSKAKEKCAETGRRLWVIESGSRCGPCFQLARWIDEHHALLEKDYLIIKLMRGIDGQMSDVVKDLGKRQGGIPWHAILGSDGSVMATSTGPSGNIGMPGTGKSIEHFRHMLETTAQKLSAEEIDQLVGSLEKKSSE